MNNYLKKAAELFGFTPERVEKLTVEEQNKLEAYGETATKLEEERDIATQAKADAEAEIANITASLEAADANIMALAEEKKEQAATIESLNTSMTEKDAKIAELEATIASLPGASDTTVTAGDEPIPTKVKADEGPKYWTSADAELAEFQAKFKKKTTK